MQFTTTTWARWKQGWTVLLKVTWFMTLLAVLLSPIRLGGIALGVLEQAVFDNAGFHPKPGIVFAIALAWAPFARPGLPPLA